MSKVVERLGQADGEDPPVKLSREQATLVQHLVELLSFCVLSHSHRASYFVLSNPVSKKITSLLYLRDKTLRHSEWARDARGSRS